jgi:hypothetical protein
VEPGQYFSQYGPLGLIVLAFIMGWIVPGPVAKKQDDEIKRLQRLFEEKVIPMAEKYAETMAHTNSVLEKALEALRRAEEKARTNRRGGTGS